MLKSLGVFFLQELLLLSVVAIYARKPKQIKHSSSRGEELQRKHKLKPTEKPRRVGGGPRSLLEEVRMLRREVQRAGWESGRVEMRK